MNEQKKPVPITNDTRTKKTHTEIKSSLIKWNALPYHKMRGKKIASFRMKNISNLAMKSSESQNDVTYFKNAHTREEKLR